MKSRFILKRGISQALLFFLISFLGISTNIWGQNPIVKDFGMADPHIYIFNGKAYLFNTRDEDKTATNFIMPDWHNWSSDNLVNWNYERKIDPSETNMGAGSKSCWASETATKNGKYYFYFSNRNNSTGLMVSDNPEVLYIDALGKPLLNEELTKGREYDPSVLIDDDGSAYICFGHYRPTDPDLRYFIAKLGEDMISLQETPKVVTINKFSGWSQDKPTRHKRNGIYYLSAGAFYGTAELLYFIRNKLSVYKHS